MNELSGVSALKRWLTKKNISVNRFARDHGFDQSELSKLLRGVRVRVSVELAAKIEDATEGEIHMRMWVPKKVKAA